MNNGRDVIHLRSRYGKRHKLVPCSCHGYRYKYESEDGGPVSFAMSSEGEINFFDPPGGPAISLGQEVGGKFVAFMETGKCGISLYMCDTIDEMAALNEEMNAITQTTGGECIDMEIDFADAKPKKVVIGMIGKAGSGKDTVADYVVDKYGFDKLAFADPLKKAVQVIFDIDDGHMFDRELREEVLEDWAPWSTRKLLQFVGTELMRNQVDESIWVKNAVSRIRRLEHAIVSDVRFPNEVDDVKRLLENAADLVFIRVTRPDHEDAKGGLQNHASEAYIDDLNADIDIVNDGTLEDLYSKIDDIMDTILNTGE